MKFTSEKLLFVFTFLFSFLFIGECYSQAPGTVWTKYLNTSTGYTTNGGFVYGSTGANEGTIIVGIDTSYTYEKSDVLKKYTSGRAWISKVDNSGNKVWSKIGGEPHSSGFLSVVKSGDLYYAAGYSPGYASNSSNDFFVSVYNESGVRIRGGTFGGNGIDRAYGVVPTSDGGFIATGFTTSTDTIAPDNHNPGVADIWVVKFYSNGWVDWRKCYGGTGADTAYSILSTGDGGYLLTGSTSSSDGDLTGNNGLTDGWVLKINAAGNIIWQKNIGGAGHDGFKAAVANSDGSYTLAGYTTSSSIVDNGLKGKSDLWVVNIDGNTGNVNWSKGFGGTQNESGYSIEKNVGNNYLIAGFTESNDGDVNGQSGRSDGWLINVSNTGNLIWQKTIGTEKDEYAMTASYSPSAGFIVGGFANPVAIDPYSYIDSTDGYLVKLGNFNVIKGTVFLDINKNGIKDAGENFFNQVTIETSKPGFSAQAIPANGVFQMDVDTGSYITKVVSVDPALVSVPASKISNFNTYLNKDSFAFAIQPLTALVNLSVQIVPLTVARPGFYVSYRISYVNKGSQAIPNGTLLFVPDHRLTFYGATYWPDEIGPDTLKWSFTNLNPGVSDFITVTFSVNPPPASNIGDTLISSAAITPLLTDLYPDDNRFHLKQIIQGSYDPNDKAESNAGSITPQYVSSSKYLNYFVRFQNTGTDTAFNVIIRDTLDTKLDWNTFEIVDASHPFQVQINDGNRVAFTFPDINLPDSNINEPASHGFIAYRIKPQLSIATGDIISNTASIYFDYNLPVVTNTVTTQVISSFSTLPLKLISFSGIYKEPEAKLNWSTQEEYNVLRFEIERGVDGIHFQKTGEKPASGTGNSNAYEYRESISGVTEPVLYYRLKMVDIDGRFTYSSVIPIRINSVKAEVLIFPNPAANGAIRVMINAAQKEEVEIRVIDNAGKVLRRQRNSIYSGNNTINIAEGISVPGAYYLQIAGAKTNAVIRFIIP